MAKLYISKNNYGKYYTKIKNNYNKCEKILAVNLPNGVELPTNYGTFDCDYFLTCYKKNNGEVEIAIKVTRIANVGSSVVNPNINPAGTQSINPYTEYENSIGDLPF